jgi:GDP-D-mannose 3', 5'-epimerase
MRSAVARFFFASSACVYPTHLQTARDGIALTEDMALPASPEGGYGWAKLYSEKLCSYALDIGLHVRIARLFNVYGPFCDFRGSRAKAPAAICYKFARCRSKGASTVSIWGSGQQIRSFLYIGDCIDVVCALAQSGCAQPVNVASDEIVSICGLADTVAKIANINPRYQFRPHMPEGVSSRIPSVERIRQEVGWSHSTSLHEGLQQTFEWISRNVH